MSSLKIASNLTFEIKKKDEAAAAAKRKKEKKKKKEKEKKKLPEKKSMKFEILTYIQDCQGNRSIKR